MGTAKKRRVSYQAQKTERNKQRFLEMFRECGNITQAAIQAHISRHWHYEWLDSDQEYARAFKDAGEHACDLLVAEARKRAIGWDEPNGMRQDENGKMVPATVRRSSDLLLMFLIKGARPDVYRDQWKGEIEHKGEIRRDPDLARLTFEELRVMRVIAERATGGSNGHSTIPGELLESDPTRPGD